MLEELGERLKRLRVKVGLTQEELGARCDLSKGFISQLERNMASPSIATLSDILDCLCSNLHEFFAAPANEKIIFGRDDIFTKTNAELKSTISWLIPNAQKNEMEPILTSLEENGKTEEYPPFAGEVFGYVAAGSVLLTVGGGQGRVKKGESFYFKANAPYCLQNGGKAEARVVWVTSPPNF